MSHRICRPLQLHSCKTNNRSTWLNCPSLKSRNFPPDSNPAKQTNIRRKILREYFKKENYRQQKFPSYVVISRDWHLLPGVRQILAYLKQIRPLHIFRKAWHITHHRILFKGISRIGAHPKSHLDVFSTAPPLSLPIWILVSTHDKLLLNDSLTRGGNLRATGDTGIRAYKYKTTPVFGNSANSAFRRRSVLCRVLQARQNLPDLSVTGLLRFLYLSLQISSHECDKRTNEGFDAYLKTRHVGGGGGMGRKRKFDQHSCWGLAVSRLYWMSGVSPVFGSPSLYSWGYLLPPSLPPGIEMSFCFYYFQ